MALVQHDDGLWSQPVDQSFLGLHVGTRMTVVRLPSGSLWVHSPIAVTDEMRAEISALGPVAHVVAPNLYHHLHVGPMIEAFPDAKLHARPRLKSKRKDLNIDAELTRESGAHFEDAFDVVSIDGTMLDEVVFVHRSSRTLVCSDLIENFETSDHFWTRQYLKASGLHGKSGFSRLARPLVRKRGKTRAAIDRLLTLDFDRILLAHCDVLPHGGRDALRDAYAWLPS